MSDDAGMYDNTDIPDGSDSGDTAYADAEPTYEAYDTDNDGVADLEVWTFPDGSWQVLADTDGNQQADTLAIDVDGDGVADIQVQITADGTYLVQWDTDLDGNVDLEQEFSRTELEDVLPGAADLLDTQYVAGSDQATPASSPEEGAAPTGEETPTGSATDSSTDSGSDAEYQAFDIDGDGTIDAEQWVFPDGTWNVLADIDGDSQADLLAVDTNGDNEPDLYITLNNDGTYSVEWDSDFDGVFESQQDFTRDDLDATLPGAADLLDTRYSAGSADSADGDGSQTPDGNGSNVNVGTEETGTPAAGAAEYGAFDDDGDGVIDFEQWVFPDGTWQVLQDTDFDLQPDQLAVDSNGNGEADLVVNLNDDGSYSVQYDQDGDGVFEVTEDFTRAELDQVLPGVGAAFDTSYGETPDAPLGGGDGPADVPGSNGTNAMAGNAGSEVPAGSEAADGGAVSAGSEAEYTASDTDGDGVVDLEQWIFPDGSWAVVADTDGDLEADTVGVDTDGDGEIDIVVAQTANGNYNVQWDQDGDGVFELDQEFTRAELDSALPGVADTLDFQYEGVPITEGMGGSAGVTVPASHDAPEQVPAPEPAPEPEAVPAAGDTVYETADTDGDGLIDAQAWTFADGTWQILTDSDLDGQADMLFIDTDGDDQADVQVCVNADGSYQVLYDQDGDGVFEVDQAFTRDELDELLPGVTDLLDTNYSGTGA